MNCPISDQRCTHLFKKWVESIGVAVLVCFGLCNPVLFAKQPVKDIFPNLDLFSNPLNLQLQSDQILCVILWNYRNDDTCFEFKEEYLNELLSSEKVHFLFLIQDDLPKIRGKKIRKEVKVNIQDLRSKRFLQMQALKASPPLPDAGFHCAIDTNHVFASSMSMSSKVATPHIFLMDSKFSILKKGSMAEFANLNMEELRHVLTSRKQSIE